MIDMFAVVREGVGDKRFSVYHADYVEAKTEAERLCKKEGKTFFVLKRVAFCQPAEMPIKWEEENESN